MGCCFFQATQWHLLEVFPAPGGDQGVLLAEVRRSRAFLCEYLRFAHAKSSEPGENPKLLEEQQILTHGSSWQRNDLDMEELFLFHLISGGLQEKGSCGLPGFHSTPGFKDTVAEGRFFFSVSHCPSCKPRQDRTFQKGPAELTTKAAVSLPCAWSHSDHPS